MFKILQKTMKLKTFIRKSVFVLLAMSANEALGQALDFYNETGINPFQTQDSVVGNESVDPFSGLVQLSNDDIVIPGNGGMDIVINRSYTSRRLSIYESNDVDGLGTGWNFHFGKLVGGQRSSNIELTVPQANLPLSQGEEVEYVQNIFNVFTGDFKACQQASLPNETTQDNISVQLKSGANDLLVKSNIAGVNGLISRNNLRVNCTENGLSQTEDFILTPDGTKYFHKRVRNRSLVYLIEDVHSNWIRIEYNDEGFPIELYRKEESEESLANGGSEEPVLTFAYDTVIIDRYDIRVVYTLLNSITYGEKVWEYKIEQFEPTNRNAFPEFLLTEVVRPDGKSWQYEYNPNDLSFFLGSNSNGDGVPALNATPGAGSINKIIYPDGGEVSYTYQAVSFRPEEHLQDVDNPSLFGRINHAVNTKTINDPTTNQSATWTYDFKPGSDSTIPKSDPISQDLALDVTTVTSPYGIEIYRHYGADVVQVEQFNTQTGNNETQRRFWIRSVVGSLVRKETYNVDGALLEARVYNWGLREISDEKYRRDAFQPTPLSTSVPLEDDKTYSPILLSESIRYSLDWSAPTYGLTSYEAYDEFGNPTRIRESANAESRPTDTIIEYEYANNLDKWIIGLPTKKTVRYEGDPKLAITIYEYDLETGNLLKTIDLGIETNYTYHPNGELASVTDANGVTKEYSVYVRGIATTQRNGLGNPLVTSVEPIIADNTVLTEVNSTGTVASITDQNGNQTRYEYDLFDRVTAIDVPLHADATVSYTNFASSPPNISNSGSSFSCALCASRTISRDGYQEVTFYDGFGRVLAEIKGDFSTNILKEMRYDLLGRVVFESLPSSDDGMSYEYDALNRQTKKTNSDGTFVTKRYINSAVVETTDELGNKITTLYDDVGSSIEYKELAGIFRLSSGSTNGMGTIYYKDVLGNVIEILHGEGVQNSETSFSIGGNRRTYDYNDQFQLISVDNFDSPDTAYTYDPAGNLLTSSTIVPNGSDIVNSYIYDSLYRVKRIDYSDNTPSTAYEYDANSNMTKSVYGVVEKTYQYNANDFLTQERLFIGAPYNENFEHKYLYNTRDIVASIEYPSGLVIDFNPDILGRQTQVGNFADNVQHFPNSVIKSYTLGNGKTVDIDLDKRLFVDSIKSSGIVDLDYSYDDVGNIRSIIDGLDSRRNVEIPNDGYDFIYRLRKASGPWGDIEFNYVADRPMDFATRTLNGVVDTYGYDNSGRFVELFPDGASVPGLGVFNEDITYRYTYDELGNISQRRKRQYDINPLPLGISERTLESTDFVYDANSRLVNAGSKQYLYDAAGMQVAEIDNSDNSQKFNFYNRAGELVFELDLGECVASDHLKLESFQIAKSNDTLDQDSDGDQLNDCYEKNIGNNPNNAADGNVDTDGDGLEDREEINNTNTDPAIADTDGDGINDAADAFPLDSSENQDSDGDGVGNNADVFPNDPNETQDSDDDGVGDNADAFPNDPNESIDENGDGIGDFLDSDGDGLLDEFEIAIGTDRYNDNGESSADYDNDGFNNRQELFAGTDINDPSSKPELGVKLWSRDFAINDLGHGKVKDLLALALSSDGRLFTGDGLILNRSGSVRTKVNSVRFSPPVIGHNDLAYYGDESNCDLVSVNKDGEINIVNDYSPPRDITRCYFASKAINKDGSIFPYVLAVANDGGEDFPAAVVTDINGQIKSESDLSYSSLGTAEDILIGPENSIYYVNSNMFPYHLTSIKSDGTVNWGTNSNLSATAHAIDKDGSLFVSNGDRIQKYSSGDGSILFSYTYFDKGSPSGTANLINGNKNFLIGSNNKLYFTLSDNPYFNVLNSKLVSLDTQTGELENYNCDIDKLGFIGKNGYIYGFVSEPYDPSGNLYNKSAFLKACDSEGENAWQFPLDRNYEFGLLFHWDRTVNNYVIDEDGTLYIISVPETLGGNQIPQTSKEYTITAFLTDSQGLADTPWPKFRHDNQNTGHQPGDNIVDSDGDGVSDDEDAFPFDPNESQDFDNDGVGDNADAFPNDPSETVDSDGDGVGDNSDAFPFDPNETQDSDGDGVGDNADAFPNDPTQSVDENGNGIGDFLDSDHDGLYDDVEIAIGTDRFSDGGEAMDDYDNDGFSNRQEAIAGTNLNDVSSTPELGALLWEKRMKVSSLEISRAQDARYGLALGSKGYLYTGLGEIFNRSGSTVARTGKVLNSTPTIGDSGAVYYGDGCRIIKVGESGSISEFATFSTEACFFNNISLNADESLFVTPISTQEGHIIFDGAGSVVSDTRSLSLYGFSWYDNLIGPENNLYFMPTYNYSVDSVVADGAFKWSAGSGKVNTSVINHDGSIFNMDGFGVNKLDKETGETLFSVPSSSRDDLEGFSNYGLYGTIQFNEIFLIGNQDKLYYVYSDEAADTGTNLQFLPVNSRLARLNTETGQSEILNCQIDELGFIGKNGFIYGNKFDYSIVETNGSPFAQIDSTRLVVCDEQGNLVWEASESNSAFFGKHIDLGKQSVNKYVIDEDGTLFISRIQREALSGSDEVVVSAYITDSEGLADTPWPKYRHDNRNTGHQPGEQIITTSEPAQILSPAEGETLQSDILTLRWEDVQADSYLIQVGSQSGLSDIAEVTVSGSQTEAVVNLPGDNLRIYVRLISQFDDQVLYDEISLFTLGSSNLVNLAEGKFAAQSSTYAAGAASRAVDGNTSGVWTEGSVTHTTNASQSWWQVDIGAHASIDSISLHNRTDCCADRLSNFYVLVSDTPFGGRSLNELLADSTVYNSFHEGLNDTSLDIALGNVTGRYVRVQLQDAGVLSLAEVQVFGNVLTDQPSAAAQILSPLEGEKLQSDVLTVTWEDVQADNYLIQIGTQRGLSDIAEVSVSGSQTQAVVNFARMHPLFYVRIVSQFGSESSYDEIFLGLASLAEGKPAEQSSTYAGGTASRAIDGNTSGVWTQSSVTSTINTTQPWWQVDLESTASIDNIIVHNRTDCCADRLSNFYVLVSDTPFSDSSLDELLNDSFIENRFHAGALNGTSVSIPFDGATGRYVRVQLQGSGFLSLAEVEVIGTPVATTPIGDGLTQENPATSCKAILDDSPLAVTGIYWLLRNDGSSAFQAYCDMTTDGGGWTMVVAQYETSRTNDWNQGIQAAYNPTLTTQQGFVFNSNEIPAHTQTGFGQNLKPTDIDYVDFQYTTGDIPLTGLTGLKTGNLYYIYRNRLNSYGSGDPRPDGTINTIPQWRDSLMFDIDPGLYTWGFSPNNPERLNRLSGASYGGVRRTQSNDDFAWTIWVR